MCSIGPFAALKLATYNSCNTFLHQTCSCTLAQYYVYVAMFDEASKILMKKVLRTSDIYSEADENIHKRKPKLINYFLLFIYQSP